MYHGLFNIVFVPLFLLHCRHDFCRSYLVWRPFRPGFLELCTSMSCIHSYRLASFKCIMCGGFAVFLVVSSLLLSSLPFPLMTLFRLVGVCSTFLWVIFFVFLFLSSKIHQITCSTIFRQKCAP